MYENLHKSQNKDFQILSCVNFSKKCCILRESCTISLFDISYLFVYVYSSKKEEGSGSIGSGMKKYWSRSEYWSYINWWCSRLEQSTLYICECHFVKMKPKMRITNMGKYDYRAVIRRYETINSFNNQEIRNWRNHLMGLGRTTRCWYTKCY